MRAGAFNPYHNQHKTERYNKNNLNLPWCKFRGFHCSDVEVTLKTEITWTSKMLYPTTSLHGVTAQKTSIWHYIYITSVLTFACLCPTRELTFGSISEVPVRITPCKCTLMILAWNLYVLPNTLAKFRANLCKAREPRYW